MFARCLCLLQAGKTTVVAMETGAGQWRALAARPYDGAAC